MENFKLISPQVLKDAAEILQTESNELARHLDAGDFKGFNYRVEIAVRTETQRLRAIEDELRNGIKEENE